MSKIKRVILSIAVIILVGGLSYTATIIYYNLDKGIACSIDGFDKKNQVIARLERLKENDKYYFKIIQNPNADKQAYVIISCTKKQYDSIKDTDIYHMIYKRNLFDKTKGKLLKLDTKPILNGTVKIAED